MAGLLYDGTTSRAKPIGGWNTKNAMERKSDCYSAPVLCTTSAARDAIEKKRLDEQKDIKAREAAAVQAATKAAEAETVANKIQSDLAQLQAEKADLQTKLQAAQAEVASIQHQIDPTAAAKTPD